MSEFKPTNVALDEQEPLYDDPSACPGSVTSTRRYRDILYLKGEGAEPADVMVVALGVEEEDAAETISTTRGLKLKQRPMMGRAPGSQIFMDVMSRAGLKESDYFYTALCRWLLPKNKRMRPDNKMLHWGMPALMSDIARVKPKIIVCSGKQVFDMLCDKKINFADAHGGWFWSEKANAHLYLMHNPYMLVAKPEWYEMYRLDLVEVRRKLEQIRGENYSDIPVNIHVARTERELRAVVDIWKATRPTLISVDGEWHRSRSWVDAQLRLFQFAWTDEDALVVEFRNEQNEFCFELEPDTLAQCERTARGNMLLTGRSYEDELERAKYRAIGAILGEYCDDPEVKYVGHHYAADSPMLHHWLGMAVWGKCVLDTEFAQQCLDETSELKLERGIAMRYTTLGRYDIDLVMWKRDNKKLCEDGYGYIPSEIIIPYSAKDVLAVRRSVEPIRRQMRFQKLEKYWDEILCPFVTDGFTQFALIGLPMDLQKMDDLRELFQWAKRRLDREFQKKVEADAWGRLFNALLATAEPKEAFDLFKSVQRDFHNDFLWERVASHIGDRAQVLRAHIECAPTFNIRAPDQIRRWLFDVAGLTPVKSTNKKAQGLPSMAWEKVLALPADKQKLYTPSVDKQTLAILAGTYPLLDEMMDLNAVGNVCKAFLKEPDIYFDEELCEEVVEEAGLHAWVASDGRVHGQVSLTETGRTRGWNPNAYNWPKYVNARIGRSVVRMVNEAFALRGQTGISEEDILPDSLVKWVGIKDERDLPSIRSCVKAPEGMVLVESDLKTAEMCGLAVISGDEDLLRILYEPDPEWACLKEGNKLGAKYVRVKFEPEADTGIPSSHHDDRYIMHVWSEGKLIGKVEEEDLLRDKDGNVVHRGYDIHWSIAERVYEKPRELMAEDVERAAGKVINFCLDGDMPVITNRGEVLLKDLRRDDLLWDGEDWVTHKGLVDRGMAIVYEYGGLRATLGHEVWVYNSMSDAVGFNVGDADVMLEKVSFGEAIEGGYDLVSGVDPYISELEYEGCLPVDCDEFDWKSVVKRKARVFDVIDAGPSKRFTCGGVLVSNSSAYGASPASLDRKIESDTGVKPAEGTGQKGLDAIAARQPRATEFLDEMARIPENEGYYRAASGRIRHCVVHSRDSGVGWRTRQSQASAMGREMRNYPMQENVGATTARAVPWLMKAYQRLGMKSQVMVTLYDSVVTLAPIEERFVVKRLHDIYLSEVNSWNFDGRILRYGVDTDFNYSWSTKPSKKEKAQLADPSWNPTPERLKSVENMPSLMS